MALAKGASYKKYTPDKSSSNPRMRAKAKHKAMLGRAKTNRADAKIEKTVRGKVAKAAKARKSTARKKKTGVFAVKSHADKITDARARKKIVDSQTAKRKKSTLSSSGGARFIGP